MTSSGRTTCLRTSATKLYFSSNSIKSYLRSRRKWKGRKASNSTQRMPPRRRVLLCWLTIPTPFRQVFRLHLQDWTHPILDHTSGAAITSSAIFFVPVPARSLYERPSLHRGIRRHAGSAICGVLQAPPNRLFTRQ